MHAPKHVLIIDDTIGIVAALSAFFMAEGYKVSTARTGHEGLAAALAQTPDAVVLDIRIPDMDGFEVCRRMKANPATAHTPVVFISANNVESARNGSEEAGGVTFIPKPFEPEDVLAAVERACTANTQ